MYKFTVCTPTYNRAHTLNRVYESLLKQTFTDFEWIIIDDGSIDDTKKIVNRWIEDENINIRYIYQKNSGKHRALNKAIDLAQGELFLTFDSDDMCVENALELFLTSWDKIENKKDFVGVTALYKDAKGKTLGMRFPQDIFDSNTIECRYKYNIVGDKWGFQRVDILRQNKFPEYEGENFLAEGVVWNQIAQKYKTRYVNQYLGVVDYQEDGLSANSIKLRINNPNGALNYYNSEMVINGIPLIRQIKDNINYIRFSKHAQIPFINIVSNSKNKYITLLTFMLGFALYINDKNNI